MVHSVWEILNSVPTVTSLDELDPKPTTFCEPFKNATASFNGRTFKNVHQEQRVLCRGRFPNSDQGNPPTFLTVTKTEGELAKLGTRLKNILLIQHLRRTFINRLTENFLEMAGLNEVVRLRHGVRVPGCPISPPLTLLCYPSRHLLPLDSNDRRPRRPRFARPRLSTAVTSTPDRNNFAANQSEEIVERVVSKAPSKVKVYGTSGPEVDINYEYFEVRVDGVLTSRLGIKREDSLVFSRNSDFVDFDLDFDREGVNLGIAKAARGRIPLSAFARSRLPRSNRVRVRSAELHRDVVITATLRRRFRRLVTLSPRGLPRYQCLRTILKACLALMLPSATGLVAINSLELEGEVISISNHVSNSIGPYWTKSGWTYSTGGT
ncbi:unnamed protein product, partial [Nesidiocoris tenuis]